MTLHTRRSALDKTNAGLWLLKSNTRKIKSNTRNIPSFNVWSSTHRCMGFLTLSTFVLIFCFSQSFSFWIWSIFLTILCVKETSPRRRGYSTKVYTGRLRPTFQPPYPFTYNFGQKRKPFPTLCLLLTNGTRFTYIVYPFKLP